MAVFSTNSRISYLGTGVLFAFPYPFEIFLDTDLQVYVDGVLQTLTADYTVSGVGDPAGGNVTFLVAPDSAAEVVILRVLPQTQGAELPANDKFPSTTVETALDKLTMLIQQLSEVDNRSLKLNTPSLFENLSVPDPKVNKVLGWKTDLTGLMNVDQAPAGPTGPTGPQGPQGNPGAGAAPTVREVDGAPTIGPVDVIEFDQNDGFVVSNPGGLNSRVDLGNVPAAVGGTGQAGGYTKGDILVATAAATLVKLPVGLNGLVLTTDAVEASGLKWAAAAAGSLTIGLASALPIPVPFR